MVVATEVEHAVHHGLRKVGGVLRADHYVAELARAGDLAGAVDGKGKDIGEGIQASEVSVQPANLVLLHQPNRYVPVAHARGRERGPRWDGERRIAPDDLYLRQAFLRPAARSSGACLSAYSLYAATIR